MPEFASCYFCGTALDAEIDPYPVVPEESEAEDRPTVDLCPVCRRKLSKVLDVALSAAEDAETTATPLSAGPDPSPLSADPEDPTADLESEDEDAAYAVEPGGEATAVGGTEEDENVEAQADVDGADGTGGDTDTDGVTGEAGNREEVTDEPTTEGEPADVTEDDESASAASATEGDGTVTNDETPGASGDDGAEPEDTGANDDSEAGKAGTAERESEQPPILSTPAAQKVIKLLQNREFPVEREEIEVVASNAYAIPAQDCEDVIDALVSEGYVDERKGQLVRPEE